MFGAKFKILETKESPIKSRIDTECTCYSFVMFFKRTLMLKTYISLILALYKTVLTYILFGARYKNTEMPNTPMSLGVSLGVLATSWKCS